MTRRASARTRLSATGDKEGTKSDADEKLIAKLGQRMTEQNKLLRMIAASLQDVESHLRQIAVSSPAPSNQMALYTIHNTEDCCVGADPDGQGENRRGGEVRAPAQRSQGKPNIARDFFEERERVHAAHLLSHIRYVANLAAGRRLGVRQIHAALDVFLCLHLGVKLEFFIATLAQLPPPEQGGES
jgi:hypothetical protein